MKTEKETFFIAVLLLLVFIMAARTPLDSDMWWHLRAGQETWRSGQPVTTDTFSYTRNGATWVNHSWLAQVGMYLAFEAGGYLGLAVVVACLAALSMGLVYMQMAGHPLLRGFVVVLATAVAAVVWSPRPQMVSLALFGLVGAVLYLYKWRGLNRLWMLPLILLIWSNMHGGYVLGLLLVGAMIGGECLNHLLGFEGAEILSWKAIGRLAMWGLISGLVVVINPNGLAMWAVPFRTVEVGVLQERISEWASPNFHQLFQQPFLWLLLGTLGSAGISKRRLDGSDLLGVAGFAYLALVARRNFGPFAMVAAPVLSRHLLAILSDWGARARPEWEKVKGRWGLPDWRRDAQLSPLLRKGMNGLILVLLVSAAAVKIYAVTLPGFVAALEGQSYPKEAVAWIEANQAPGRLFNAYNWGGYLSWMLPRYPVFVDGRTDLYDDAVLREYLEISAGTDGCLERLDAYGVDIVLVEADAGLVRALQASGRWSRIISDGAGVLFVRESSVTQGGD